MLPKKLGGVIVSPAEWPGKKLEVQPGDLSKFAPQGEGFYGYHNQNRGNPFVNAPPTEELGGIIYFGNNISKRDFYSLLRILQAGHGNENKKYALFMADAQTPGKEGYIRQARIVSRFGLQYMFGAINENEYESYPNNPLAPNEVLWKFIGEEKKRWGTSFTDDHRNGLAGMFGGDGDYAREELSFGFMLENNYHDVCRIWSRAWLVTK